MAKPKPRFKTDRKPESELNKLCITKTDRKALTIIYHTGTISKHHLRRLVWKNKTTDYRLHQLFHYEYLNREPFMLEHPKKETKLRNLSTMYSLTDKGIKYLVDNIGVPLRTAIRNRPGDEDDTSQIMKLREYYQMSELWCQLIEQDIIQTPLSWHPSKFAKQEYGITPGILIHSILETPDGYDAYFFIDNKSDITRPRVMRDQIKSGLVGQPSKKSKSNKTGKPSKAVKNTIPSIKINRYFIITDNFYELPTLKKLTEEPLDQQVYCINCGTRKETLKDFSPILTRYTDPDLYYRESQTRLQFQYYKEVNLLPTAEHEASPYKFIHNNEPIHIAELISGNIKTLERLLVKGTKSITPTKLFVYIPTKSYYSHRLKLLLPKNHENWLNLIIRDRPPGQDIFSLL